MVIRIRKTGVGYKLKYDAFEMLEASESPVSYYYTAGIIRI